MAHTGPIPGVRTPQVFHICEKDGRIIKAPRRGDNDYARPKEGWRVIEGAELAAARKRVFDSHKPAAKPGKEG